MFGEIAGTLSLTNSRGTCVGYVNRERRGPDAVGVWLGLPSSQGEEMRQLTMRERERTQRLTK